MHFVHALPEDNSHFKEVRTHHIHICHLNFGARTLAAITIKQTLTVTFVQVINTPLPAHAARVVFLINGQLRWPFIVLSTQSENIKVFR